MLRPPWIKTLLVVFAIAALVQGQPFNESQSNATAETPHEGAHNAIDVSQNASYPNETNASNSTGISAHNETSKPAKPKGPVLPFGEVPSTKYKHIDLLKYYFGELEGSPDTVGKYRIYENIRKFTERSQLDQYFSFYTFDVKKKLGSNYKVPLNSTLHQMGTDIKLQNIDQYQDLIIQVGASGDDFSDPDLYINLNDSLPTLDYHDLKCQFYGEDVCIISGRELKEKKVQTITVGVMCERKCSYKLQLEMEAELFFKAQKMHKLYFKRDQQRVIRFSIPDSKNTSTVTIKGIHDDKLANFEMLILEGNEVPDTSKALLLNPAWENGYVGKFHEGCNCFCVGCNYTVLVTARDEGYINIGAAANAELIDLNSFPGGETYDAVDFWGTQCYTYMVTDPSQDFTVQIQSFTGNPDVYVHPRWPINSWNHTLADFSSMESFRNEELILTPENRDTDLTGLYYICVFGRSYSNYKISAKNVDHSIMLKAGISEGGYLDYMGTRIFHYSDSILEDPDTDIDIHLHVLRGEVRVKTKFCRLPSTAEQLSKQCTFTTDELMKEDEDETVIYGEGDDGEKSDRNLCLRSEFLRNSDHLDKSPFRDKYKANCIYVVGVVGMSRYISHYAVVLEATEKDVSKHAVLLSENVPLSDSVKQKQQKLYKISIDDPEITKLQIQLTTIHGDPDMFVSSKKTDNPRMNYDHRSINSGYFPDIVTYDAAKWGKLNKTYYVGVYGESQSAYKIEYLTENKNGTATYMKLIEGEKSQGIFEVNATEILSNITNMPSLVYHMQVPTKIIQDGEEIEVRLDPLYGTFLYIVQKDTIPDLFDEGFSYSNKNQWIGGQFYDVSIKKEDLSADFLEEIKQDPLPENLTQTSFYIKVYPLMLPLFNDTTGLEQVDLEENGLEKYRFTIAFYDEEQLVVLEEGMPTRGVVTNQERIYYQFQFNLSKAYEVSLTSITGGNPDILISFNSSDKFPSLDSAALSSLDDISTEDITLDFTTISSDDKIEMGVDPWSTVIPIYIGIMTKDPSSVFSLVVFEKTNFNPIRLELNQVIGSRIRNDESKYFYTIGDASSSKPLKIDVKPTYGNPGLRIALISDLQIPKAGWIHYLRETDLRSELPFGIETVVLDPATVPEYEEKCDKQCIVLVEVLDSSRGARVGTSFKIQMSQDFIELSENVPVEQRIQTKKLPGKKDPEDLSTYQFFKFYKPCSLECNLQIEVLPLADTQDVITLMVNYQSDSELALHGMNLPTFQNDPMWTAVIKRGSVMTIDGTEKEFFFDRNGKAKQEQASSQGFFFIAVQSYSDLYFKIKAKTAPNKEKIQNRTPLQIEPAFIGDQDKDIFIYAGEEQYYYFKNWRREDLNIYLLFLGKHYTSHKNIEMSYQPYKQDNSTSKLPKFKDELDTFWFRAEDNKILIHEDSASFCDMCYYIIRVKNTVEKSNSTYEGEQTYRLIIQQMVDEERPLDSYNVKKAFKTNLRPGRPQPIKVEEDEDIIFNIKGLDQDMQLDIELLIGDATIDLYDHLPPRGFLFRYPVMSGEPKYALKDNLLTFNISKKYSKYETQDEEYSYLNSTQKDSVFSLKIRGVSSVFEAVVYLKTMDSVNVISTGHPHIFSYAYEHGKKNKIEPQYFMFLPQAHEFDLQVNAKVKMFNSMKGDFYADDSNSEQDLPIHPDFFKFRVSVKALNLEDDLKSKRMKWSDIYVHDEQFDSILETQSSLHIYEILPQKLNPMSDVILVRVQASFNSSAHTNINYAQLMMQLVLSSEDISYLAPGNTVRGVVTDDPNDYKIYEFYVNPMQFPKPTEVSTSDEKPPMDLFITMTPCSGNLNLFITDDFTKLFKATSQMQDNKQQLRLHDKEGMNHGVNVVHKESKVALNHKKLAMEVYIDQFKVKGKRLENVEQIAGKKLYIGVSSATKGLPKNSIPKLMHNLTMNHKEGTAAFKPLKHAFAAILDHESTFELSVRYMPSNKMDFLDKYVLKNATYGIHITSLQGKGDERAIEIEWSPILEVAPTTKKQYVQVKNNIIYKLYLGYSEVDLITFSSICNIETEELLMDSIHYNYFKDLKDEKLRRNGRKLCAASPAELERRFLAASPNHPAGAPKKIQMLTSVDSKLLVVGNDYLKGLKYGVVVAHIFSRGEEPLSLAYAPVSFEGDYDFDHQLLIRKRWFILGTFVLVVGGLGFLVWFFLFCSQKQADRSLRRQVDREGISMRSIKTADSSRQEDTSIASNTVPSVPDTPSSDEEDNSDNAK